MLEVILSTAFVGMYLAILVGVCLVGVIRLRKGTDLFRAMILEFKKWNPREHDQASFDSYKNSVAEYAAVSSTKTCGMWSSFLDDIQLSGRNEGSYGAECASESVDKLRDNLIFSYATSHRMSRLNGSVLAGLGFIGTLVMICAASLSAEPFLLGEAQFEQALSVLLSGGGLAFICAAGGILCSLGFNAYERSAMSHVESLVDDLISLLRSQIDFRTERHYLAEISTQMQLNSENFLKFAKDIGDRVVDLKDRQFDAAVFEQSSRENAREIAGAIELNATKVVEAIQDTHEKAQRMREESASSLTMLSHYTERSEQWWEGLMDSIRESSRAQAQRDELQYEALCRMEVAMSNSVSREEKILDTLIGISRGIEQLDEGIEQDIDYLVDQNKETQTTLMHYLNDTLELQLSNIFEQMKNSGEMSDSRTQTMTETLERALEGIRESLENDADTAGDYIHKVRTSVETGISAIKDALERSSLEHVENKSELVNMLKFANSQQKKEKKKLHSVKPSKVKKIKVSAVSHSSSVRKKSALKPPARTITKPVAKIKPVAKVENKMGSGKQLANVDTSLLERKLKSSRELLRSVSKNFGVVGEQVGLLTSTCQIILRELNKMNEEILKQTESRLARYGKAYQPLAESNLLICEMVTRGIKDVGTFKRSIDFDYAKITEQIDAPIARISSLETVLHSKSQNESIDQGVVSKIERWLATDSGVQEIEAYLKDLKLDVSQSAKKYLGAQEVVSELKSRVEELRELVEKNVLEQVTNWPDVLDKSRIVRDFAERLASIEKGFGIKLKRSDSSLSSAMKKLTEFLDRSEKLLLHTQVREIKIAQSKRKEG